MTWLTRSRLTGVLWAVAVGGGFVGITLGNTLGFVSPALATLASWLPGSAAKLMQAGPSLVDAREASLAFASVGSPATHVLVTAHVFTLITTIVALLVVPRRDMA